MLAHSISKKISSAKTVALSQNSWSYSSCSQRSLTKKDRLSLEAAKARLDFVKKENAVKIHVELEELGVQKEIAVAQLEPYWE